MGIYDKERGIVYGENRYITICAKCGSERLKRHMNCILVRQRSGNPVTLCYLCESCFVRLMDELEVSM